MQYILLDYENQSLNDRKKPYRQHKGWSKSGYTGCTLSEVQALDAAWKAKPYGKEGFPSLQAKRDHRPLFGIHLIKHGLLVIDVDKCGELTDAALESGLLPAPAFRMQTSRQNGWHLYYDAGDLSQYATTDVDWEIEMPGGTLSGQIKYKGYCVLHPQHVAEEYASDNGVIAFEKALRESERVYIPVEWLDKHLPASTAPHDPEKVDKDRNKIYKAYKPDLPRGEDRWTSKGYNKADNARFAFYAGHGRYGFTNIMLEAISSDCPRYLWYETICRVAEVNDYSERGKAAVIAWSKRSKNLRHSNGAQEAAIIYEGEEKKMENIGVPLRAAKDWEHAMRCTGAYEGSDRYRLDAATRKEALRLARIERIKATLGYDIVVWLEENVRFVWSPLPAELWIGQRQIYKLYVDANPDDHVSGNRFHYFLKFNGAIKERKTDNGRGYYPNIVMLTGTQGDNRYDNVRTFNRMKSEEVDVYIEKLTSAKYEIRKSDSIYTICTPSIHRTPPLTYRDCTDRNNILMEREQVVDKLLLQAQENNPTREKNGYRIPCKLISTGSTAERKREIAKIKRRADREKLPGRSITPSPQEVPGVSV